MTGSEAWEVVVGLEVHCELRTATKLFCSCRNAFGDEPNTNICPVCLGLPGSLPVLNAQAVELAMRIGVALHSDIRPSIFHRKNYFYPDMPKDYQISQYDQPINAGGWLELADGTRVGIARAHLEEDTGKSTHVGGGGRIHEATHSLVDYNRAGVPLVETVSDPDIRSAEQARSYVNELRAILMATGASDGKMEEGSLRVDANVSVRPAGATAYGTRCEVKNLNSTRSLVRAIDFESARQVARLEAGERVVQETRHWDEGAGRTSSLRSKEEAFDYRYFPEPDLVPLVPDDAWLSAVAGGLAPMPAARRAALLELVGGQGRAGRTGGFDPGLVASVATVVSLGLDGLVTAAAALGADPRLALNRAANEAAPDAGAARDLAPTAFAELLAMEADGRLSVTQVKVVLKELLEGGHSPAAIAQAHGFGGLEASALAATIDQVVAEHPEEWARYCQGDDKVAGFLVGAVMKATSGRANGKAVTAQLSSRR